ncbi:hypothetical protein HZA97_06545 [Candidatus Woesearchaeota archaeon]|nr:hypothetical protein [Candidatus Woesearchaeota archaeon]
MTNNNTILPDDFDFSSEEFDKGFVFDSVDPFGKKYQKPEDKKDDSSKPITPVNRIKKYD